MGNRETFVPDSTASAWRCGAHCTFKAIRRHMCLKTKLVSSSWRLMRAGKIVRIWIRKAHGRFAPPLWAAPVSSRIW